MTETPRSALSRQASSLLSRRTTAQAITGGSLAALLSMLARAEAKKKKRKRRKKKRKKPALTCAEQCPGIDACFGRPVGPPLCGDNFARGDCVPCDSDQDCVDTTNPYCLTDLTQAVNNETRLFTDCGDYAVGLCTSLSTIN